MKEIVKKLFCAAFLAIIMIAGSKLGELRAEESMEDFLYGTGMPQEVIEKLTENQKKLICETIDSEAEFSSYNSQEFIVGEGGEIMPTAAIPDSDLTLSLVAYKGSVDTKEVYVIFPSFVWKKSVNISNDSFGFLLADGWEVFVDEANKYQYYNLHVKGAIFDGSTVETDIEEVTLYMNGQSYRMPKVGWKATYEGNAIFYAEKKSASASHKAILQYVYDSSNNYNVSYGLGIAGFSFSITSNSDKLSSMSKYFGF